MRQSSHQARSECLLPTHLPFKVALVLEHVADFERPLGGAGSSEHDHVAAVRVCSAGVGRGQRKPASMRTGRTSQHQLRAVVLVVDLKRSG